ncbi:MAG: cytochrome c biogenesis CcdA family protein [Acidimicrobiales bacterium]
MDDILFGGTVVAAFLGGVVALFAPCCISVMLPAYFATSFQRTRALLSMTFVFALGVAAVILPIAFGATALTRLIVGRHTLVFVAGGLFMLGRGLATLAGWQLPLPMPGMKARRDRGPAAVFGLGAFSGVASACCAPVPAGVIALSGSAGSFLAASAVGVTYVFGMVLPLLVIALLWDRYNWGESRLLRGRTFTVRLPGRTREIHSSALASGLLLVAMAGLMFALAVTGPAMSTAGWQARFTAQLQHDVTIAVSWLDALPGWVYIVAVLAALATLAWKAIDQAADARLASEAPEDDPLPPDPEPVPVSRTADPRGEPE